MPSITDSLYEIAATDAWRDLLDLIEVNKAQYEKQVITVVKRTDFKATEASRCSGRVEAMEELLLILQKVGKKYGST